ncbi:MDR family MFS transporter [Gulosibacter sp. 10]|uniref:MDR family MFS transporter n=1 Tax=Gulosibacter sp. 10 TaxID=1255570 RepID=UPI00097F28D4|nr:MDR family MFS transporter [Gulosibacter sp. 10]SJM50828.1 putative transport protein [Gulosibacter sp. 10]
MTSTNTGPLNTASIRAGNANAAADGAGDADRLPPGAGRVIWLLIVAAFVAILNETTMANAIPHLNRDLGIPPELGQWFTSAFMLTMAVVIPTTGYILQRFTTRQVFVAAMLAFAIGTAVCFVAPGFTVLLLGRVIQAAGTGVMMPLLMTTVMTVVPPKQRGRWMGMVGMVISLAPALGPTASGAVLDTLGWRWLFGIILPIAVVALAIGAKWLTNLGDTSGAPFDVLSVVLSALAFGGIVFGLSQFGGEAAETGLSPQALGGICVGAGAVMLALFVWRQLALQREDKALLDLRTFASRNFTIAVVTMTILACAMFGTLTLLPQFLQNVMGLDALQTGLVLMPGSVLMGILAPFMGRIYDAKGPRALLVPGTILVSASLFVYSTVGVDTHWLELVIVQTVISVGLAMSFTPLFSASLGSLPQRLYSHGSASLNTMQQVGGAVGVAVLIAIYSGYLHRGELQGLDASLAGAPGARTAFLVGAIVSLVPVVLAWFVRRPADQEEDAGR